MFQLKHYPTPIAGLTLGIFGITNFWANLIANTVISNIVLVLLSLVGLSLLIPLLLKFIRYPRFLLTDLQHPTVGSVLPTLAMSLMYLSHTISLFSQSFAIGLWFFAIILHFFFFSVFCIHRAKGRDFHHHLVPSWFVPPIGMVVACLTLPSPSLLPVTHVIVAFGITVYAIMLPVVIYRLSVGKLIEEARKPTLAILAAPASLTLAGYITVVADPSPLIVMSLFGIAVLMTVSVYLMLAHLLRLPFTPAYSAFTFPLAVSATALLKMRLWSHSVPLFEKYGHGFFIASLIEGLIASVMIAYVYQHYVRFLTQKVKE
ncbi:MAG: TDT family transporter [Gammaproteobacteria bacterium]|nr:TDT family transporter [Gammaproteobacteria bacterium]